MALRVHSLTGGVTSPMTKRMRRSRLAMLGALISAVLAMVALCPCGALAQPGMQAHDCCPADAGIQAVTPSCCTATAHPAGLVAAPALAATALVAPLAVAMPTAAVQPVTVGSSQPLAVFVSPPLNLRI